MSTLRSLLLALAGATVLIGTTYDILRTTVAPAAGAGPVTRVVALAVWKAAGTGGRALRRPVGPAILLLTIASWVTLLWLGWTLVLLADAGGLERSPSGATASTLDVIYFAGFTLFTLGVGDIVPVAGSYKLLTPLASLHGLFTVTLSITYLLPVVSAAVERRQQAATIWGLGGSATQILCEGWHRGSFADLESALQQLTDGLLTTVERHPSYPVLNYFMTAQARTAFSCRVAALDEATMLLQYVVHEDARPARSVLLPIQRAVDDLVETSRATVYDATASVPPWPDVDRLRQAGIPLCGDAEIGAAAAATQRRRQQRAALVSGSGYSWDTVEQGPEL